MKKNILIVGGSSGVGLDLAKHYVADGHSVCITGRCDPQLQGAKFHHLDIGAGEMSAQLDELLNGFSDIHTVIYAAGFLQRGRIETLDDGALTSMVNLGLLVPMMLVARLKPIAPTPLKVMLIGSSSGYTPRPNEPAYAAAKAGLSMFGASIARDPEIGKVLVAAPSGINTRFWAGTDEDTSTMLQSRWVAEQIVDLSSGAFKYKYAKILRDPSRVEVVDCYDNAFQPINAATTPHP